MKSLVISVFFVLFSVSAFAEPAVGIDGDRCVMVDGNENFVETFDTKKTLSFSKNGNFTYKCKSKEGENTTGSAVQYDASNFPTWIAEALGGYPVVCWTRVELDVQKCYASENWKQTVSEDGSMTLTCHFRTETDSFNCPD